MASSALPSNHRHGLIFCMGAPPRAEASGFTRLVERPPANSTGRPYHFPARWRRPSRTVGRPTMLPAPREHDMRRLLRLHVLRAFVAELPHVDAREEMFPRSEQNRRKRQMQLVDQPRAQILPDRRHAAADPNVLAFGGRGRALEGGLDPVGDEMEGGAALHLDRRPRMVGEHEDGNVIGRRVAPPPLPALVGPGPAHRPEHVAAQDPGPDIGEAADREILVDAGRPAVLAGHLVKHAGREEPPEQPGAAHAERIVEALIGSGAEPVEGEAEGLHAELGHRSVFLLGCPEKKQDAFRTYNLGCHPGESRGPYSRGRCLWTPAFAGVTREWRRFRASFHVLAGRRRRWKLRYRFTPRRTGRSRPRTCAWHRTAWSWDSSRPGADPS